MNEDCANKLDERLSEALKRAAFSEAEPELTESQAFQNWLEEGRRRQSRTRTCKIRRTALAAAAVIVCAFLLTGSLLLLTDYLPPSLQTLLAPEESMASPDSHSAIQAEGGNAVIGGDGNGNSGPWTATFASYEDMPEKYRRQVIWFEDMPEGYELTEIEIRDTLNRLIVLSRYETKNGNVVLKQLVSKGADTVVVETIGEEVRLGGKPVYVKKADDTISYTILMNEHVVQLVDQTNAEKEKIETMIASIRIGWSM